MKEKQKEESEIAKLAMESYLIALQSLSTIDAFVEHNITTVDYEFKKRDVTYMIYTVDQAMSTEYYLVIHTQYKTKIKVRVQKHSYEILRTQTNNKFDELATLFFKKTISENIVNG